MGTYPPVERTLTWSDHDRLTRLASLASDAEFHAVNALLESSDLVASASVPATVVTMYSQVLLLLDTDKEPHKVTVCYPEDAQPSQGFISVFSPLGTALLGLRLGDIGRWLTPLGQERTACILDVLFQP